MATGEDARDFLQGQFTQDLAGIKSGEVRYGFWLNQKGRVMGDAVIARGLPQQYRMVSWSLRAPELVARLEAYIIADDVALVDETGQWKGWQVAGPGVNEWLAQWPDASPDPPGWAWGETPALYPESGRLICRTPPPWPRDWVRAGAAVFERARLAAGVPAVPLDLGAGDFPQEAGQEGVGVSFDKGCYLGQEVMARLAATGRVRRRLGRVSGTGPAPQEAGLALSQNRKRVGELRSRTDDGEGGWLGLAMISPANFDPGHPLQLPDGSSACWREEPEGLT